MKNGKEAPEFKNSFGKSGGAKGKGVVDKKGARGKGGARKAKY
jgi:hypothetical protein